MTDEVAKKATVEGNDVTLSAREATRAANAVVVPGRVAAGALARIDTGSVERLRTLTSSATLGSADAAKLSELQRVLKGPVAAQFVLTTPVQESFAAVARASHDATRKLFADLDAAAPWRALMADLGRALAVEQSSALANLVRVNDFHLGTQLEKVIRAAGLTDLHRSAASQLVASAAFKSTLAELGRSLSTAKLTDPAWLRVAQGAQLADGLSSVARLARAHESLLGVRGLAAGTAGYLGTQQAIAGLSGDIERPVLHGWSLPASLPANRYLDSLRERSPRRRVEMAGYLTHGAAGAVMVEGIGARGLTGDERESLADTAHRLVTAPWQFGRELARRELLTALERVHPYAVELLDGAWHNIVAAGPAAATSASHCLVEAFDQTLRALAPDADVEAWIRSSGRPTKEMYAEGTGRLTRKARIAYALRNRSKRDRQAVLGLEASLSSTSAATLDELQSGKHDGQEVTVAVVRLHALLIEDVLMQLLLGDLTDEIA